MITYQGDGRRYVAIMRNPEYEASDLGELGFTDNSRFEKPERLTVQFAQPAEVKELLSGREFTKTSKLEIALDPWKPVVLEVREPGKVADLPYEPLARSVQIATASPVAACHPRRR